MGYKNEREGRHTAAAPWLQGSHGQPPHLISLHHPCTDLLPVVALTLVTVGQIFILFLPPP